MMNLPDTCIYITVVYSAACINSTHVLQYKHDLLIKWPRKRLLKDLACLP